MDCILTVRLGPRPTSRAEPVRVPTGMLRSMSDIWSRRVSTSWVMADWRRLNSAMLLCSAVTWPVSSFSREIRLLYWISPPSTASLTAAVTSWPTRFVTRVTARFPSRARRWDVPTSVSVISSTDRKKQISFAFCLGSMGDLGGL